MKFSSLLLVISIVGFVSTNPAHLLAKTSHLKNVKAGEVLIDCMPEPNSNQGACEQRG